LPREGAELAFTYVGERFKDRITEFAAEFDSKLVFDCDVTSDEQIAALFADLGQSWSQLGRSGARDRFRPAKPSPANSSTA
jgi:enoyl-[acyl-carrier protein] reductase I